MMLKHMYFKNSYVMGSFSKGPLSLVGAGAKIGLVVCLTKHKHYNYSGDQKSEQIKETFE